MKNKTQITITLENGVQVSLNGWRELRSYLENAHLSSKLSLVYRGEKLSEDRTISLAMRVAKLTDSLPEIHYEGSVPKEPLTMASEMATKYKSLADPFSQNLFLIHGAISVALCGGESIKTVKGLIWKFPDGSSLEWDDVSRSMSVL